MPGKAAVTVALQPDGDAAPTSPQKSCPFVLKKVMDLPPPNILEEGDDGKGTAPPEPSTSGNLAPRGRLQPPSCCLALSVKLLMKKGFCLSS